MGKAEEAKPVNRLSEGNLSQAQGQWQNNTAAITLRQRKDANKLLASLARQHQCSFAALLRPLFSQVKRRELSRYVLDVLIERLEKQGERNELTFEETAALQEHKGLLQQLQQV